MENKDGIKVEGVTFDQNGEVAGLDDAVLDEVSAGVGAGTPDEEDISINIYKCGVAAA